MAGGFINRYVFPDGELEGPGFLLSLMNTTGFEIRHEENLREHYALTLAGWCANLDAHWDEAVAEVGEGTARVWRLYMAGSRLGFERNVVQLHQILGAKLGADWAGRHAAPPRLGDISPGHGRGPRLSAVRCDGGLGSGVRQLAGETGPAAGGCSPSRRSARSGDRGVRGSSPRLAEIDKNGGMDAAQPGPGPGRRDIVVLGSTGSIGTQAADIIRRNPGRFRVAGLAAGGGNPGLLAAQAIEFGAEVVAVASEGAVAAVRDALRGAAAAAGAARPLPKLLAGPAAVAEAAAWPCDVVLNGVTGAVGLTATLAALDAGRVLALANKESLIIGGPLVASRASARADRAGRLGAFGHRPVPARRERGRGGPAGADRQRRAVLRPAPGRTGRRHAGPRRWPTRTGTWARSSRSTRPRW